MKKAFIPLGISGGFAILGLVGALALSVVSYVPENIKVESAGGNDVTVSNPDELSSELKNTSTFGGSYYQALIGSDVDPEPVEGKNNSIAISCEGRADYGTVSFERSLIVTQNHLGAFYQYDGWSTSGDVKTEQNLLFGISRYGMFVKWNSYSVTALKGSLDEYSEIFVKAIQKRRGNWYKVEVSEEPTGEMTEDGMIHDYAVGLAQTFATSFSTMFLSSIDSNNTLIGQLITIIDSVKSSESGFTESGTHYYGYIDSINLDLYFDSVAKPRIKLSTSQETENLTIEHIDNTKVRIVESAKGDFYNLFGEGLIEAAKEAYEEAMKA
jgi:hypothetical protein